MSTNQRPTFEAAYFAAPATTRRRCVPPRPRGPVPMSLHQRWRERPRCPALRVTPGRRGGVVHAIVGRVLCPCLRTHSVQENRAARVRMFVHGCEERSGQADGIAKCSRMSPIPQWSGIQSRDRSGSGHHRADDADAVLGIVRLSASLRPGQWPGLRALTTPARGTDWQLRDGGRTDEAHNDVDDRREARRPEMRDFSSPPRNHDQHPYETGFIRVTNPASPLEGALSRCFSA